MQYTLFGECSNVTMVLNTETNILKLIIVVRNVNLGKKVEIYVKTFFTKSKKQ